MPQTERPSDRSGPPSDSIRTWRTFVVGGHATTAAPRSTAASTAPRRRHQRPPDREHLTLSARQRGGELLAALAKRCEELMDLAERCGVAASAQAPAKDSPQCKARRS